MQVLDGVGAGIFGALFPLVLQDLTHGTGRFSVSLGALTTIWGVGAAVSNILAGWIVLVAGYHAAFIALGIIALAGLALYATAMPETAPEAARKDGLAQAGALPQMGETDR